MVAGSRPTLLSCPGAENAITLEDFFLKVYNLMINLKLHTYIHINTYLHTYKQEEAPGKTCIVGSGYAALQFASFLTKLNQGQVTVLLR